MNGDGSVNQNQIVNSVDYKKLEVGLACLGHARMQGRGS